MKRTSTALTWNRFFFLTAITFSNLWGFNLCGNKGFDSYKWQFLFFLEVTYIKYLRFNFFFFIIIIWKFLFGNYIFCKFEWILQMKIIIKYKIVNFYLFKNRNIYEFSWRIIALFRFVSTSLVSYGLSCRLWKNTIWNNFPSSHGLMWHF